MGSNVRINIEKINSENVGGIISTYMKVFSAHPWHEEFECSSCGAGPYSFGCKESHPEETCEEFKSGKLFKIDSLVSQNCNGCGNPLETVLKPMYTIDSVKGDLQNDICKEGFAGVSAKRIGEVVSFCWGYGYPTNHPSKTGSTWYLEAIPQIQKTGTDVSKAFYHHESATLNQHSGLGIATMALESMLEDARINNMDKVVFRTINPAMIRCYEKVLGLSKGSLQSSFSDPNPAKRQKWYVLGI